MAIAVEAGILLGAAYAATRQLWVPIGLTLISGGSFGADASLPAVLLCLAVGVAFLIVAHRTGRVRPPVWRRQSSVNDGR